MKQDDNSMKSSQSNSQAAEHPHGPAALRVNVLRAGLALAVAASLLAFAVRAEAQTLVTPAIAPAPTLAPVSHVANVVAAPVPFAVGEELVFKATFGKIPAGTARMRVEGIDTIRGRLAYHVVFSLDGGIPFFRVHDRYESWIDIATLSSLRHTQSISEGRYHRNTTYEMFPERSEFQKNDEAPQPSVDNPLDDGSFIYAVRALGLRVGDTVRNERYFQPAKNPVVLTGLREDTVTVGAGTYATIVIRPTIKTTGIFSENGEAQVWFTNDERRLPVQVKSKFSRFSLTLSLQSASFSGSATSVALR
jgi:hypothetical protein